MRSRQPEMVDALLREMEWQRDYLNGQSISTIYFGGGTPSLLLAGELERLLAAAHRLFRVETGAEITLEANPDDIREEPLRLWKEAGINRLSIGIQSFEDDLLRAMNRAHTADQALTSLEKALVLFPGLTLDLIYGIPGLSDDRWKKQVDMALSLGVSHLSCYALTVEPKTALEKLIRQGQQQPVDPDAQSRQFLLLMDWLDAGGFEHYEISNFARPGYRSRHNSSYWSGTHYLGIGPSAHSFNGVSRQWNVANNALYLQALNQGQVPFERETLTPLQQLNEYIMTSLRTAEGLVLERTGTAAAAVQKAAQRYLATGLMTEEKGVLRLTREGKLMADGIAAALFQE